MITPSTIYWITRAGNISGVACALALGFFIVSIILTFIYAMNDPDDAPRLRKAWITCLSIFAVSTTIAIFTPTTKELCAIIALPAIANNEHVTEIGSEIVVLAKDWLQELKPNKEQKGE